MYINIDYTEIDIGYFRMMSPLIVLDKKCEYGDIIIHNGKPHIIATNFNYKSYDEKQAVLDRGSHILISNLELVYAMSSDFPMDIPGFSCKIIKARFYKCKGFDKDMNEYLDENEYYDRTEYKYLRTYK